MTRPTSYRGSRKAEPTPRPCGWRHVAWSFRTFPCACWRSCLATRPEKFTLRVFHAPTEDAMKAATAPNMEVHIVGQPDVKKLHKDDYVQFTRHRKRLSANAVSADLGRIQGQRAGPSRGYPTPASPAPGRGGRPAAAPVEVGAARAVKRI
mgnify:CR=1 FL=1